MRSLLLAICVLGCSLALNAQVELTTLVCEDAIEFCPEVLLTTTTATDVGHPDFCGTNTLIHNPQYFQFTPVFGTVVLSIEIMGCSSGSELQYAIVDTCAWKNGNVLACDPGFEHASSAVLTGLTVGKAYYVVVDGGNAATCAFEVSLTNIAANGSDEQLGSLVAPDSVNFGEEVQMFLPDAPQSSTYLWKIPWLGHPIITDTAALILEIPAGLHAKTYEICASPATTCSFETCTYITIEGVSATPISLICEEALEFCPNGFVLETGQITQTSHYGFCGQRALLENPHYLKFVPTDPTVQLIIDSVQCSFRNALQFVVVDTCQWTNDDIIACNPGFQLGVIRTLTNLTVGKDYFLMVDGDDAARCSYTLTMSNIAANNYPGALDKIVGPDTVEAGKQISISLGAGAIQKMRYYWTVPWSELIIATDTAFLEIEVPEDFDNQTAQVCVEPIVGCEIQQCVTIAVVPSENVASQTCEGAVNLCPNNLIFWNSSVSDVGHASFCGPNVLVHNPAYFKFTPISESLTCNIQIISCEDGGSGGNDGLQYAIIDTCDWTNADVVACIPLHYDDDDDLSWDITGLVPYRTYYFMADGINADVCTINISMDNVLYGEIDTLFVAPEAEALDTVALFVGPHTELPHVWSFSWQEETISSPLSELHILAPCALIDTTYEVCVEPVGGCVPGTRHCAPMSVSSIEDAVPGTRSTELFLSEGGSIEISAREMLPEISTCGSELDISFAYNQSEPSRTFNCEALITNGGPYFLETIWLSDAFGNVTTVDVTIIVRDTFGHCLPADIPRDTLEHDTSGIGGPASSLRAIENPAFHVEWVPNPWSTSSTLHIGSPLVTRGELTLYNNVGSLLHRQDLAIEPGANTFPIASDRVGDSGLLFYQVRLGDVIKTGKLVKTR